MRYPLITNYIDALNTNLHIFKSFDYVEFIIDERGEPYYYSGNFSVVFKVKIHGRIYALKCFTRGGEQLIDSCRCVSKYLERYDFDSVPLVRYSLLEDEFYVPLDSSDGGYFPVVVMDWVLGESLRSYVTRQCRMGKHDNVKSVAQKFDMLAAWLLEQDFAHGDLKDDNIIISASGDLKLVDYDAMFTPGTKFKRAIELGTAMYQHPLRDALVFDQRLDDYSIALISTALHITSHDPDVFLKHIKDEGMILDPNAILRGEDQLLNHYLSLWFDNGDLWSYYTAYQLLSTTPDLGDFYKMFKYSLKHYSFVGLSVFESAAKYGYVNEVNECVIPPIFDYAEEFVGDCAYVYKGGNELVIKLCEPCEPFGAGGADESFAPCETEGADESGATCETWTRTYRILRP